MTLEHENPNGHDPCGQEKFSKLCALAMSGALSRSEQVDLEIHLKTCEGCREAYKDYVALTKDAMPMLAPIYAGQQETENWDDTNVRRKLFARVDAAQIPGLVARHKHEIPVPRRIAMRLVVAAAIAACVAVAASVGAYRYGHATEAAAKQAVASATASASDRIQKLALEKKAADDLLSAQTQKLDALEAEGRQSMLEIEQLHSDLRILDDRSSEIAAAKANSDEQLRTVSQQRDALAQHLHDAQEAYQNVQVELGNLRAERDKATLRMASLETRANELTVTNREDEQRVSDQQQFLSSDRDIRELMGARQLYIADVFDVDSSSRTRKPFGRVFYTQGKSLIFYAFDLDHQPDVKNAGAFQAWGQKETPQGEKAQPVNLGILYMDNEKNRRWALRCDDPRQLVEIDAVFVTVEPHGGSEKPTGKPFLYAMLRKEANHP